jgi:hypothetical protein
MYEGGGLIPKARDINEMQGAAGDYLPSNGMSAAIVPMCRRDAVQHPELAPEVRFGPFPVHLLEDFTFLTMSVE